MLSGFKQFLFKTNALALAVGVIIGAAVGKVVSSLVADILMPFISLAIPGGDWRSAKYVLGTTTGPDGKTVVNSVNVGTFLGNVVDFIIIALVIYLITKALIKEPPPPATKACPKCLETIPLAAAKCRYCTADLA
ncbi:MAG: large conductance mechanosensitive channel protein MscL [Acidobacteriota bacterium]|nr:large conductance mechanosensitive channel protein MscL [Acidobacteriota bacterium]